LASFGSGTSFALASLLAKVVYAQGINVWLYTAAGSLVSLPFFLPLLRQGGWRRALPAGAIGAASMVLYNLALSRLDLTVAVVFAYTFPAFAVLLAWLVRGRRPTVLQLVATVLCLTGVIAVSGAWTEAIDPLGVLAALVGAVMHAGYGLVGEGLSNSDGIRAVALSSVLTLATALLFAPEQMAAGLAVPLTMWGWFALSALIARVIPMWLFSTGSRIVGAGPASLVATVELPLALLIGILLLNEQMTGLQVTGVLMVVLAICLQAVRERAQVNAQH
jgi:drug/metabolite transporter (DMT)-like permease